MNKLLTILLICAICILPGCSALKWLKGGSGVNANAQVGKENTQQAVVNQENTKIEGENVNVQQKETDTSISTKNVEQLVQNNTNVPIWYLLLLVVGWLLPSPQEIWAGFVKSLERIIHGSNRKRSTDKSGHNENVTV